MERGQPLFEPSHRIILRNYSRMVCELGCSQQNAASLFKDSNMPCFLLFF